MSTALAEVTYDGEVIEEQPRAPLTLFGTSDPSDIIERATSVATALADVIKQKHLSARIGNRDHVLLEGWTLLGSMLGVFGDIEWTRAVEGGWEARAVARTLSGGIVGSAEAMCTRKERTWAGRDEYAIRSMAQTRALSKALRLPLGFIVELAGYAATPADELPDQPERDERREPAGRRASSAATTPAPARSPDEQRILEEILATPAMTHARMSLLADAVGVPKGERATLAQLNAMLDIINRPPDLGGPEQPGREPVGAHAAEPAPVDPDEVQGDSSVVSEPPPSFGDAAAPAPTLDDVLAATGGELIDDVPPKPSTKAYAALTPPERATARAYWAQKDAEAKERPDAELIKAAVE